MWVCHSQKPDTVQEYLVDTVITVSLFSPSFKEFCKLNATPM